MSHQSVQQGAHWIKGMGPAFMRCLGLGLGVGGGWLPWSRVRLCRLWFWTAGGSQALDLLSEGEVKPGKCSVVKGTWKMPNPPNSQK